MSKRTWQVAASAAAVCAAFIATQAAAAINVQVLSSMPQLVSGGDALVKITGATAAPTVTVGGADVTAAFKGDATKGWVGLVSGLNSVYQVVAQLQGVGRRVERERVFAQAG